MGDERSKILIEAQAFAEDILARELPDQVQYHSINHTYEVVHAVLEIARQCHLSRTDSEIVELAAWFHDLGYIEVVKDHERVSANMALDFLSEKNYDDIRAAQVVGCIMATQIPQSPKNKLEAILCDADMMHLAKDDYFHKAALLHHEIQQMKGLKISDADWLESSRKFINRHRFFTDYVRERYAEKKEENLKELRDKLLRLRDDRTPDREK